MASREQFQFAFSEDSKKEGSPAPRPESEEKVEKKNEYSGPSHIELDDECQYCSRPFESEGSCQYCQGNPTKRAYLKALKK